MDAEHRLVTGARADLAMLPRVVIHGAFLRKKDREERLDGSAQTKTLADYVHPKKMEQVRESCQSAYGEYPRELADERGSQGTILTAGAGDGRAGAAVGGGEKGGRGKGSCGAGGL
jgi:hypothetical protein